MKKCGKTKKTFCLFLLDNLTAYSMYMGPGVHIYIQSPIAGDFAAEPLFSVQNMHVYD